MVAQSRKLEPPQYTDERQFNEISAADYAAFFDASRDARPMPNGIANQIQLRSELRADRYCSAADEVHWLIRASLVATS